MEVALWSEAAGLGELVFHIRAAAGARLPQRIAARMDELVILAGGLRHAGHEAGAGDFYLPSRASGGELVASQQAGFSGIFTASDEAWEREI